jgi:hypothetical protein
MNAIRLLERDFDEKHLAISTLVNYQLYGTEQYSRTHKLCCFPVIYGNRRSITAFTRALHFPLSILVRNS